MDALAGVGATAHLRKVKIKFLFQEFAGVVFKTGEFFHDSADFEILFKRRVLFGEAGETGLGGFIAEFFRFLAAETASGFDEDFFRVVAQNVSEFADDAERLPESALDGGGAIEIFNVVVGGDLRLGGLSRLIVFVNCVLERVF